MKITYNQESTNQSIELELKQFTLFSGESKNEVVEELIYIYSYENSHWNNVDSLRLSETFGYCEILRDVLCIIVNDKKLMICNYPIDNYVPNQIEFDKLFEYCIKEDIYVIFTISNPLSVKELYKAVLKHKLFENDLYTEIEVFNSVKYNNKLMSIDIYGKDYCKTVDDKIGQFKYNVAHYIDVLKEHLQHFLYYTINGDNRKCTYKTEMGFI